MLSILKKMFMQCSGGENMNLFLREIKANRKSLLIWCIAMLLMLISGMGKFAGSITSGQSMNDLVRAMPKSLQTIFGVGSLDLSKASGYYGVLYLYLALMATIHASMLGANIISKEERDKTSEFLMVKPISRKQIIISKLSAALLNIFILNIVTLISSISIVGHYAKGEAVNHDILLLMVGMFILQLMFLFIGTGIAVISKKPKTASNIATTILLGTYILSMLIDLSGKFESLKYFTPFKYYEAKNLMYGGNFDIVFLVLSFIIIALFLGITYELYDKRDLNV